MCTCLYSDGHPFQVRDVQQVDEGLYSVTLRWNEAPAPANASIMGYEITVLPVDQGRLVQGMDITIKAMTELVYVNVYAHIF